MIFGILFPDTINRVNTKILEWGPLFPCEVGNLKITIVFIYRLIFLKFGAFHELEQCDREGGKSQNYLLFTIRFF